MAKFFTVHLFDNSSIPAIVRCNWTVESLGPQQKGTKVCHDNTTASTANYSVVVDVFDEVIESNEANNAYPIFN
jgi:subtilase family serine protease